MGCCKLFCWPPCVCCFPSVLATRLSLVPPPASYDVQGSTDGDMKVVQEGGCPLFGMVLRYSTFCYGISEKGSRIACILLRCTVAGKYTIMYSHGNGVDIGQELVGLYDMGRKINCNVFTYDYSGYGRSTGKPSEANLYLDAECALDVLRREHGVPAENVILFGRSIGSVPTLHLATKYPVAGVVLVCPVASGLRTIFPQITMNLCFDVYQNTNKVSKVLSPVLVIHGTEDEIVNISQGYELYRKCSMPVDPLWVEGVGHNDIELAHFLPRLRKFIFHEIVNKKQSPPVIMKERRTPMNSFV